MPPPGRGHVGLSSGRGRSGQDAGQAAEARISLQDSPDLLLLLRLLALGQGAWDMIDSQVFKEPKMVTGSGGLHREGPWGGAWGRRAYGWGWSEAGVRGRAQGREVRGERTEL